jgi:hypothetical protein
MERRHESRISGGTGACGRRSAFFTTLLTQSTWAREFAASIQALRFSLLFLSLSGH